MENELVRYSRAGDVFHYRWAARRCLRMIYPKSLLRQIIIEGSKEREMAGEYVIDVTEYSDSDNNGPQEIAYFQLKHTTVRKGQPFNLSDLKGTVEGFANRYYNHFCIKRNVREFPKVTFLLVTNRPVAESIKRNILAIGTGKAANRRFQSTFEAYTGLKGKQLNAFCASLKFIDGEGDYNAQRYELHVEMSQLLAGIVDSPLIDSVTALIQEKAVDSNGEIVREDILKRFGVTSERDLYPAPAEFEKLDNPIPRKQHRALLDSIFSSTSPVIIHAEGGVGKTVFARQIANSLPVGSFCVIYDCFGGGRYRNRSEHRHHHRHALVQIANELASQGLCAPLIHQSSNKEDELLRRFKERLNIAAKCLRKANENAILLILIDAADNAEMAAKEFNEPCFVHEILREPLPDGCRLVALCRTERTHLLDPSSAIPRFELEPFTEKETLTHLRRHFPQATNADGLEFHGLTNNGNPRVQANALGLGFGTVEATLDSLGPSGTTVEKQIEAQLYSAVSDIKDKLSIDYQERIEAICTGLASLPPFIPVSVLAIAAGVEESTVKSFVADLGRPLWLSDTSVQFRDEPTEKWFRERFWATTEQINSYVARLEPLANKYAYVAEVLPYLLLQAGKYSELVALALSDDLLPIDNPIDQRNVRIHRLQFAFKAALKLGQYADATKLALRAGEEVAGDARQLDLLTKNVDLIAPLQNEQRVQELAFRCLLSGGWDGSENVYSAALLSSVEDLKGEARSYLRAASNWLHLYFEERKKSKEDFHRDRLTDDDIVELAYANLNLYGASKTVDFILGWSPPEVVYRVSRKFIKRIIDAGNFDVVDEISLQIGSRSQYMMIALAHELLEVGRFPAARSMMQSLNSLAGNKHIPKPGYSYNDTTVSAIVSFTEACSARNLSKSKILQVLDHYIPVRAPRYISGDFHEKERDPYLRANALRYALSGNFQPNIEELLPTEFVGKEQTYKLEQDVRQFKEVVGGLLPWYMIRARLLVNDGNDILEAIKDADQQSSKVFVQRWREFDPLRFDISQIYVEILLLSGSIDINQAEKFYADYLIENKYVRIHDRLKAMRGAFRLDHLSGIRSQLEQSAYEVVASDSGEGPETRAGWYIDLARAVLPVCRDDAAVYFNYAIEAVSKFGDEIVQRWEAVSVLADRSADGGHSSPETAYRFIRCAEVVGDNVAREKYWNRKDAISTCFRLSPVSAFAALSRWRDRDVGWFADQLPILARDAVHSNYLPPSVGWSLSAFFENHRLENFASMCIEKELLPAKRQHILDTAIRDLMLDEATEESWQKLKNTAQKYFIRNDELDRILVYYAANKNEKESEEITQLSSHSSSQVESEPYEWGRMLDDLELATSSGISQAIKRFDEASIKFRNFEAFWPEVFKRIDEGDARKFLSALVEAESADIYDVEYALSCMPNHWRQKVSVKQDWGKVLESIARRFAFAFVNHHTLKYFLDSIRAGNDVMPFVRKGILEGLSSNSDLADANTFFGFVEVASPLISPQQATDLLDFGLTRFELHFNDEYSDGCWSDWLIPPDDMSTTFAGFVWAALGSPRSETRWQAAHCVLRLAGGNCEQEIKALLEWMRKDIVGAFGSHKFPFYNLHARLYLLIVLARVSIDNPQILRHHHSIFSSHALGDISHILIQKFSAEIALNIEKAFPNTYSGDVVKQLNRVGVSQLPVLNIEGCKEKRESYWHTKGEVDTSLKFYHGYDFDRYWFEPLGEVFGISGKQVEELATEVVIKEWRIDNDGSFNDDPRAKIWRSSRNERETYHSHGSYPRTDNYSCYLSYHAMLVVAAKLLQKMPVVHSRNWHEDEWADWLRRHSLTRKDGRWLADRRDPAPMERSRWISDRKTEAGTAEITPEDFLDSVLCEREGEAWLNVAGSWEDGDNQHREKFIVSSALVSPEASESLLHALSTCSDPHDFKLPDYQEECAELEAYPFEMKGWVWRSYPDNGLDKYDPFAGQISFPPYKIGKSIIEQLNLSPDIDKRKWYMDKNEKPSLLCDIWSSNKTGYNDERLRQGMKLSASLQFLRKLCLTRNTELILEIQIDREFKQVHRRNIDESAYKPPYSKIYILSKDGRLRDERTNYKLRENPC